MSIQPTKVMIGNKEFDSVEVTLKDSGETLLSKQARLKFIRLAIDSLATILIDEMGE